MESSTLKRRSRTLTNSKRNRQYGVITYLFVAIFLALIVYFAYFMIFKSSDYINSSYNPRLDSFSETIVRGSILSSDGEVLAQTIVDSDNNETREYPYDEIFAHVVGYDSNGKSGLELSRNSYLLQSHAFFIEKIINNIKNEKNIGDNVVTTLNVSVQKAAYEALGNYDGAVVAIKPSTGEVVAMVSKPDYDPNNISDIWDELTSEDSDSSALLNRATQGLYPPGSTFKVITTLEYLKENNNSIKDYSYNCSGSITRGDTTINCYKGEVHGMQNLKESFADSCNTSYANIGLGLDIKSYISLCNSMLFNKKIKFELTTKASEFDLDTSDSEGMIMQTAIGQGETLVSPLHMALLAAGVDNGGVVMQPYLVDRIENYQQTTIESFDSDEYATLMDEKEAKILKKFMRYAVTNGTASALSSNSYKAYGKTGTAEFNSNKDSHAWFIGFASKEGYEDLAIAVIVEDTGAGSKYAVPVADKVFDAYFK